LVVLSAAAVRTRGLVAAAWMEAAKTKAKEMAVERER